MQERLDEFPNNVKFDEKKLITAGKHLIVFGEPAPGRKPSESALDNPTVGKHMKAAGSDLLPINHGILWCPDAS